MKKMCMVLLEKKKIIKMVVGDEEVKKRVEVRKREIVKNIIKNKEL
jgi:hypothetical protein